jgi:hypothetical protein
MSHSNAKINRMYLEELAVQNASIGCSQLGRRGEHGHEEKSIRVQWQCHQHAIIAHPPAILLAAG